MNKANLHALGAGLLFAAGLVVSGMTNPAKVLGFLDLWALAQGGAGISWVATPGKWDPSLAFVMASALAVTLPAFAWLRGQTQPLAAQRFDWPTRQDIDSKLIGGAVLFGTGWGLSGYCPGPALASLLTGGLGAVVFCAAMLAGMWAARQQMSSAVKRKISA